ncbi:cupredoxin family copper-binding protein [Ruegeria pomeroyi]|uniref:Copper-binding protein, plastocyanin/azurin family n=2 Tax=Ruegeria pomeroyi TaxID=89184 RepID=Q5LX52_RUEPO|nr:copper-binding protein, plastocyanin/azurin family [Ruegeria pomeroyi DSS-3]NVK99419.1 cupredoxin family copper-binding protein [Ruegeria pomeroyi]NVL03915.1 cupredoxin family copper-binding protein [Ruegeria pomeroyi]QWV10864.1 cupredoxin family copper-binding protein [Ruegeria pomeroyi]HCE71592.1 copper-binding protein [Ruegeria sp.]
MRLTRRQVCFGAGGAIVGSALPASGSTPVVVDIRSFVFEPAEITIRAGETIVWINHDFAPHTATDDEVNWDTGELEKDAQAAIRFDTPGTYPYFCAYHPHMTGTVIVTA